MRATRAAVILLGASLTLAATACGSRSPAASAPGDGAAGDTSADVGRSETDGSDAATGDASATDTHEDTNPVTAQYRACVTYFRAQCNRQSVCRGYAELADPCPTITDRCPDIEFAPGTLRTPDTLLACAEAWRTLPCAMYAMGKFPSCAGIAGSLADGAPCIAAIQCAGGSCGKGADPQHPKCGACAPPAAPAGCGDGGACQSNEQCVSGSCHEAVTGLAAGQACDATHYCAAPNICRAAAAGGTTCQPPPKLGEACSGIRLCADDSLCTAAKKCEATPTEGQACKRDALFNRYTCVDADTCDETAAGGPTCVVRPGAGGTCTPTSGGSLEQGSCAQGLYCACPSGAPPCACVRRRQEGDTCADANDLCVPGTSCAAGKCAAVPSGSMAAFCGP